LQINSANSGVTFTDYKLKSWPVAMLHLLLVKKMFPYLLVYILMWSVILRKKCWPTSFLELINQCNEISIKSKVTAECKMNMSAYSESSFSVVCYV